MPTIYQQAEIEVSIDEFYSECSSSEKEELIDYLKDDGYLKDEVIIDEDNSTYLENEFNIALQKLSANRLVLSIEEEEIIKKIASRL
jgi:ribosomal protein S8